MRSIPKIVHQTWKSGELPQRYLEFQQTWKAHLPGWDFVLWDDAALRQFIASRARAFLPIFDAYRDPICRADAGRYYLLYHLGGLYIDVDFECLDSVSALFEGNRVVIGREPDAHATLAKVRIRGLDRVLCPSLLASPPRHPFWLDVFAALERSKGEHDPLDATGPFLLTRAHRGYRGRPPVRILSPRLIYPVTKHECWNGRLYDLAWWDKATSGAVALHHWDGNWFRPASAAMAPLPRRADVRVSDPSDLPPAAFKAPRLRLDLSYCPATFSPDEPLVSCLMVTRGRAAKAKLAIQCYQAQTWPRRELVVVDDDEDECLQRHIAGLGDSTIRHVRLPPEGTPLGALRNVAVAQAAGAFICQWDDDDLYDPMRITAQMETLVRTGADACFLPRWVVWWPRAERLAISRPRLWEGSILCRASALPAYPEIARGEDSVVKDSLCRNARVAQLDMARLYIYIVHGENTFDAAHTDRFWTTASHRFEGPRYARILQQVSRRVPVTAYPTAGPEAGATTGGSPSAALPRRKEQKPVAKRNGVTRLLRFLRRRLSGWRRCDNRK